MLMALSAGALLAGDAPRPRETSRRLQLGPSPAGGELRAAAEHPAGRCARPGRAAAACPSSFPAADSSPGGQGGSGGSVRARRSCLPSALHCGRTGNFSSPRTVEMQKGALLFLGRDAPATGSWPNLSAVLSGEEPASRTPLAMAGGAVLLGACCFYRHLTPSCSPCPARGCPCGRLCPRDCPASPPRSGHAWLSPAPPSSGAYFIYSLSRDGVWSD